MIKFFRKIRQSSLSEGKTKTYLKYAIGEIILVIIGILIALAINNLSERKKSEAKVFIVFEELLKELESDIRFIKKAGLFYDKKDSLFYAIMTNKLSKEDYQKHAKSYDRITSTANVIALSNNAHNKLIKLTDAIPSDFDEIMKDLYKLYKKKEHVDLMGAKMVENVNAIKKYQQYNYSWAINNNQQELADYLYTNKRFKSDLVHLHTQGVEEHFEHAFYYLESAIKCYKEIAHLLNKPIDNSILGFDLDVAKTLTGTWTNEQVPGYIIRVYIEDNRILYKNNTDENVSEFHILSKTKLINSIDRKFLTLIKDGNKTYAKLNDGKVFKKTKR